MADQRAGIHAQTLVEPVHVLAERFPVHVDSTQHFHRDGFDVGQKLRHPLFLAALHRRQRQGAIAEDDRGGAMLRREGAQRVPCHLRVIMAVVVDEPRRHRQPVSIDGAVGRAVDLADFDDPAVLHGNVATERRHPRAIDDPSIPDQQVIGHLLGPSVSRAARGGPSGFAAEGSRFAAPGNGWRNPPEESPGGIPRRNPQRPGGETGRAVLYRNFTSTRRGLA